MHLEISDFLLPLNPLTVTPKTVAFKGSVEMKHLEEAALNFQILGFHPKQVSHFMKSYPRERRAQGYFPSNMQCNAEKSSSSSAKRAEGSTGTSVSGTCGRDHLISGRQ